VYLDSHCHLDPATWGDDAGVDAVIDRARAAGVMRMVTIGSGYGFESASRAVAVAARHPGCLRATVGLHPHDAREATPARLEALFALADAPGVVALGEMGLDYHYDSSPRDVQRDVFRAQLREARRRALPVVIHDRDSDGETLAILDAEDAWPTGVLYHCFTGDVAMMEAIVARGGSISIPGIVTFKNGEGMRAVAAAVPLERLLIETDSPFLTPVPYRGRRNEPAYVTLVAAAVAQLRGMRTDALAAATTDNALRFFGWS
jgi:TatD DNase family protein